MTTSPNMLQFFQNLSRWLAAHASLFIIAVAVFTFFVPDAFVWVRGTTQTVILGIIMLTMCLTLTTEDFRILARRPLDILTGACAQFLIMPCAISCAWHSISGTILAGLFIKWESKSL